MRNKQLELEHVSVEYYCLKKPSNTSGIPDYTMLLTIDQKGTVYKNIQAVGADGRVNNWCHRAFKGNKVGGVIFLATQLHYGRFDPICSEKKVLRILQHWTFFFRISMGEKP